MANSKTNFISGTDALVELLLAQSASDKNKGLNTSGFVSGYRGSPLGGFDQALWKRNKDLQQAGILFQPAINEDLGATALIGTQKVETDPERNVSGVFGMWYGKGPGVDRSGDALKHGNAYGSSPNGGVLIIAGDDHGCVSSSMSHQSDLAMMAWSMPVLHPASVTDYIEVGLWGWGASRISGAWVGFKAISEIVESGITQQQYDLRSEFITPTNIDPGPDGLHWRWPDLPGPQVEQRLQYKLKAIEEFAQLNPIDRIVVPCKSPQALLVTVGKAHHDVLEALRLSDITPEHLAIHSIAFVHVRLVFPLSPLLKNLASQVEDIFVVEEKASIVETLLACDLFNATGRRNIKLIGKRDSDGKRILPDDLELRPSRVVNPLSNWLNNFGISLSIPPEWKKTREKLDITLPKRTPYFCAGCPHSTSTRIPEGSHAQPGIGCHVMAAWMDRNTGGGSVQMGGEGVDWIGHSPFTNRKHIFQNLGDGTYFHSAHLAIRQSIAAGSNITFKVLYNDAVAMTGGQPVDGVMTVQQIAALVLAEGAKTVAIVAENPGRYRNDKELPVGIKLYHRDHLEAIQKEFRDIEGVTVIIYDQVCATELRRRRKRGLAQQAKSHAFINELVCEGCGDCQIQSNCLAVIPVNTPFGKKRAIDQNACNSDLSCLKGFCPSFITVEGSPTKNNVAGVITDSEIGQLIEKISPPPTISANENPYEVLIAGIGGTGIVTAAKLLARAAEYDKKIVSVLNFTGFAQKGGEVLSHIRFHHNSIGLNQVRIDLSRANLVIAADLVVGVSAASLEVMSKMSTTCVINTHETQTGAMLRDNSLQLEKERILEVFNNHCLDTSNIDAETIATRLVGDSNQTNIVLLGYAWQQGTLPINLSAIESSIYELGNISEVAFKAFQIGRLFSAEPKQISKFLCSPQDRNNKSLNDIINERKNFLSKYQNLAYADCYIALVNRVRTATSYLNDENLSPIVAENLFKLMSYKDEYEVARLFVETDFLDRIKEKFEKNYKLHFYMSPPLWRKKDPRTGQRGKIALGPWIIPLMRILAKSRFLRGSPFDLFGWQAERKMERKLLAEYQNLVRYIIDIVTPENISLCCQLAQLPNQVLGFGYIKNHAVMQMEQKKQALLSQLDTMLNKSNKATNSTSNQISDDRHVLTGTGS
jgi:indolepyruvate ferredoxin oxidoreductase